MRKAEYRNADYRGELYHDPEYGAHNVNMVQFTKKYKKIMKKLLVSCDVDVSGFTDALRLSKALHAGGSLTRMMTVSRKHIRHCIAAMKYGHVDCDFYVSTKDKAHVGFLRRLELLGFIISFTTGTPPYDASFMRQNQIMARVRMIKNIERIGNGCLNIDVMIVHDKNDVYPIDVVQNFDLSCCEIWFDGVNCDCSDVNTFQIQPPHNTRITSMRPQYVQRYMEGNKFLHRRVQKYERQGFVVTVSPNQSTYLITTIREKKSFANIDIIEFLTSKLFKFSDSNEKIDLLVSSTLNSIWPFLTTRELEEFVGRVDCDDFMEMLHMLSNLHPIFKYKLLQIAPYILNRRSRNATNSGTTEAAFYVSLAEQFSFSVDSMVRILNKHNSIRERVTHLFAGLIPEEPMPLEYNPVVWGELLMLDGLDTVMLNFVSVGDYLSADEKNIVVIAIVDSAKHVFLTTSDGVGSLTDVNTSKHFVKCNNADTSQLSSNTNTTQFKTWYIKLFGKFNICIHLSKLHKVLEKIKESQARRLLLVENLDNANASNVETTFFKNDQNIFREPCNLVSATHCNTTEYFFDELLFFSL